MAAGVAAEGCRAVCVAVHWHARWAPLTALTSAAESCCVERFAVCLHPRQRLLVVAGVAAEGRCAAGAAVHRHARRALLTALIFAAESCCVGAWLLACTHNRSCPPARLPCPHPPPHTPHPQQTRERVELRERSGLRASAREHSGPREGSRFHWEQPSSICARERRQLKSESVLPCGDACGHARESAGSSRESLPPQSGDAYPPMASTLAAESRCVEHFAVCLPPDRDRWGRQAWQPKAAVRAGVCCCAPARATGAADGVDLCS